MTPSAKMVSIAILLAGLALAACGLSRPSPTPYATPFATPSNTAISSSQVPTPLVTPVTTQLPTRIPTSLSTPVPIRPTTVPVVAPPPGLIYETAEGLWRVEAGGSSVRLLESLPAPGHSYLLSPDNSEALYVLADDIWVVDLLTGMQRNLTNGQARLVSCPRWVPRRNEVIFYTIPVDFTGGEVAGFLTAVQTDGSNYRVLDPAGAARECPAPSPDGQLIAYDRQGNPWFFRWGQGPEPLDPAAFGLSILGVAGPAWSPDGQWLAWIARVPIGDEAKMATAVFDLVAQTGYLLPTFPMHEHGGGYGSPLWSPDGQWLYSVGTYRTFYKEKGGGGTWIDVIGWVAMRPDGTNAHPISRTQVWSPDSRWVAFSERMSEQRPERVVWLTKVGTWNTFLLDLPAEAVPIGWVAVQP